MRPKSKSPIMGAIQIQRAFSSLFRLFQLNTGLLKLPRHVRTGSALRRYCWYCHNARRQRVFLFETDVGGAGRLPKPSGVSQARHLMNNGGRT
jgi:hypothetical protein